MSNPAEAVDTDTHLAMRSIIQRIATGPELSKDISREEAHLGTRAILDEKVDPVQAGIFFIALRMKRETEDENKGVLDAIREATHGVTAEVDELVDIDRARSETVRRIWPFLRDRRIDAYAGLTARFLDGN